MTPCERATYDAGIVAVRQMALTTAVMLRIGRGVYGRTEIIAVSLICGKPAKQCRLQ